MTSQKTKGIFPGQGRLNTHKLVEKTEWVLQTRRKHSHPHIHAHRHAATNAQARR